MRRLTPFLLAISLCLALPACSTEAAPEYPYYDMEITSLDNTSYYAFSPDNIDIIADWSALIVKGVVDDDARAPEVLGDEIRIATVSTLTITEVIKGDVQSGDTLNLYEGYYPDTWDGVEHLVVFDGYMPSEVGKEYLFFLSHTAREGDNYTPNLYSVGRYPVVAPPVASRSAQPSQTDIDELVEEMTVEELYLSSDDPHYRQLYKEAIEKYMTTD